MKNTYIKLAIGIMLFSTWLSLILFNVHGAEDIITAIKAVLFGLGVYHLGDRPGPPPEYAGHEGGFASLGMLGSLLASALLLTGCASIQQAIQGYGTVAVTGAHAAADTVVQAQKVAICDLPYSAIQRNPDMIPAVQALCPGPASATLLTTLAAKP